MESSDETKAQVIVMVCHCNERWNRYYNRKDKDYEIIYDTIELTIEPKNLK